MELDQELDQCSSRADLQAFIEKLNQKKSLVHTRVPQMDQLEAPRVQLAASAETASTLSGAIEEAEYIARGVSDRISAALVLYNRAQDARKYIDDTITLRSSLVAMQDAIDMKDWERAASAAKRASDLPASLKQSEFALRMVPSTELPEEPEVTLKSGCDGLAAYFLKQFDIASASRDTAALTRWFKLLPQVNHAEQGLQRYARFVAGIVAGQSRNLLAEASIENQSLYGVAMSRLFESIAAFLDQHSRLVEKYYGDSMPDVIDVIQNEVDVQAGLIIDTWYDERGIEHLLADISAYQYPGLVTLVGIPTEGECDIDIANVGVRISELHLMLNRWQLYLGFLQRWPRASIEDSALQAKFKEILKPCFDKMVIFMFRRSVERSLIADQLPESAVFTTDQPLVSSTVDQVTLVFSTLLDQVLGTAVSDIKQSVFQSLLQVLRSDYIKILARKISTSKSKFSSYVYLNDLQTSLVYVEKIIDRAKEQHPVQDEAVLNNMASKIKASVQDVVAESVRVQFNTQWSIQCRALCGQCFKGNYLVSPTEPESLRGKDFQQRFEKMVAPLKESLHPVIYNKFMSFFAQSVAKLLETWIFSLENGVNELGSIALDRDVSKIISCISKAQYSLRDNFAKVAVMVNQIETGKEDDQVLELGEIELLRKVMV